MASVSLPSLRQIYNKCHVSALLFENYFLDLGTLFLSFHLFKTNTKPRSEPVFEMDFDNINLYLIVFNTWLKGFWIILLMIFILL